MLPTLLTTGNLLLGFSAIMLMILPQRLGMGNPQLQTAVWLIVLAGVLDAIDGPVARWGGRKPAPWGREFDSLADLISFGIAPVILIVVAVPAPFNVPSIIFGSVYVMAGTWRLARFIWYGSNVMHGRFEGLPITGAGLAVAALWLFENAIWGGVVNPVFFYILVIFCSLLMISRIEYEKFPELGRHDRRNRLKWWIAAWAIAMIVIEPALAGLPIALLYLVHGPVGALVNMILVGAGSRQDSNGS